MPPAPHQLECEILRQRLIVLISVFLILNIEPSILCALHIFE